MDSFLNECSLHQQFHAEDDFARALIEVNKVLSVIADCPTDKHFYYDKALYYKSVVGHHTFSSCLNRVRDKSIKMLFVRRLKDLLFARDWHEVQLHQDCQYAWNGQDVRGTSIAELAERRLRSYDGFLVNFLSEVFPSGSLVTIVKRDLEATQLDCISHKQDFRNWCRRNPQLGIATYNLDSGRPPQDEETILGKRSRFQATSRINQGRRVYIDRETNYYWCTDNDHVGSRAHIEVFNAGGQHVGEASLEGTLDEGKRDATKSLDL